jgi:hypothetical protein
MPDWYASPPAFSSMNWSRDWTSDDAWWYAIWDARVVNMFINALNERLSVQSFIPSLFPTAHADDDMGTVWINLLSAVAGQTSGSYWLRPDFDPSSGFANSSGLGLPYINDYRIGVGWQPTAVGATYMQRWQYPREIATLTDHGVAGWRAMYVGNRVSFTVNPIGLPVGKIFAFDGTNWVQEDDATSSGLPDLVRADATTGLFPTGWTSTAACLDGYVLNWLRDVIDLMVFGVEVSNTASQWWSSSGRLNQGSSPLTPGASGTAAECISDYNGGTHILTGVGTAPRVQGGAAYDSTTGKYTYSMQKVENHISAQIGGAGISRTLTYYESAAGGADYLGNPQFVPQDTGYGGFSNTTNQLYYPFWSTTAVGALGGVYVNSPTFGDISVTPGLPSPPPVTGTNTQGANQWAIEQYRLQRYDVAGGFKYVSGYAGT